MPTRIVVEKHRLSELGVALVGANLAFVVLWVIDYPVEEWIGIVVVGYLLFVGSRMLVALVTYHAVSRLHAYAMQIKGQYDLKVDSNGEPHALARTIAMVFIALVTLVSIGTALILTVHVAEVVGLTTLDAAVSRWGSYLLLPGMAGAVGMLGGSFLALKTGERALRTRGRRERRRRAKRLHGHWQVMPALPMVLQKLPWSSSVRPA